MVVWGDLVTGNDVMLERKEWLNEFCGIGLFLGREMALLVCV